MENTYRVFQKKCRLQGNFGRQKILLATFFGMPCHFECSKTFLFYHINIITIFVEATPYLLDLLHDRNPEVQRVCDATLQLIGEVSQ